MREKRFKKLERRTKPTAHIVASKVATAINAKKCNEAKPMLFQGVVAMKGEYLEGMKCHHGATFLTCALVSAYTAGKSKSKDGCGNRGVHRSRG